VIGDRLRDNFLVFSLSLCPGMSDMFCFMRTDGIGCLLRTEPGRSLKGNRRVVGTILILSVFTGLTFIGIQIRLSGNSSRIFTVRSTGNVGLYRCRAERSSGRVPDRIGK
jgi:hypothetical protein